MCVSNRSALLGGADGLDCIRAVRERGHLRPGAWLLFEHGHDQAEACRALLEAHGYRGCKPGPILPESRV
jgi:release factor glutamine methyltransferase